MQEFEEKLEELSTLSKKMNSSLKIENSNLKSKLEKLNSELEESTNIATDGQKRLQHATTFIKEHLCYIEEELVENVGIEPF